jgi:L-alanine-DL-glutamate epimerase-like enolase superfamily enzyme
VVNIFELNEMNKREFIKRTSIMAGAALSGFVPSGLISKSEMYTTSGKKSRKLSLRFIPYELQLKHVFTIATSSRTTTPVVLTELEYDGVKGYGEASMPPYLGESHASVTGFLSKLNLGQFSDPFLMEDILAYVDGVAPGNYAAKASVDIALHDLTGKLMGKPWFRIWGLDPSKTPVTSFTIGIDTPEVVRQKVAEAAPYKVLKVKLGSGDDKTMVTTIRSVSDKPVCADVNQGWTDRAYALEMAHWLKEQGVIFLEQPLPKERIDDIAWLTERSPLPVIADEALQTYTDLFRMKGVYSGINIKLMKCGGMNAAYKMAQTARAMGMKVMIGCMTETSCAITAAAQLSPLATWADLDGNLLISNDCFAGVKIVDGRIILIDKPGLGLTEKTKMFT